jgi:hypothetical protein
MRHPSLVVLREGSTMKFLRQRVLLLSAGVLLTVMATGCTLYETKDYYLTGGNGVYLNLKKPVSDAIVFQLTAYCHYDRVCVGNTLHDQVQISGWGAAEWHTATHYYGDLWDNAINKAFWDHSRCITLHKDIWLGLNWETHGC